MESIRQELLEIEASEMFQHLELRHIYFFFKEQFFHLNQKIDNMLDALTTQLLANEDTLEAKVDTLITGFNDQKTTIANLQTTINGLTLSDADKAALQAHIDALTAKNAAIDTALAG